MTPEDIARKARRAADDPRYAATPEGQAVLAEAARMAREARRLTKGGKAA